ncbi:MAG TPA: DUF58 domain-containing protein, partial [Acidimicrobiales bacterium]|nr:DUF58 domain-containing protein [Acidimicrobiales bacterium]
MTRRRATPHAVAPVTSGLAQPARPLGAIYAWIGITIGWYVVARSSGQGWVQAVGDVVFGVLAVGVVGPWLVVRQVRTEIDEAPTDGGVGSALIIRLHTTRPVRTRALLPSGPVQFGDQVTLLPTTRGVYTSLIVEVATAAPFGLQWWRRRLTVPLPNPLYIAPRRVAAAGSPDRPDDDAGDGVRPRVGPVGDLRAPRPYVPGDARRLVHWPASAHTGELMVREMEFPEGRPFELVIALPADPDAGDRAAEEGLAAVIAHIDQGVAVILTTDEAGGRRRSMVTDRREAGRRLAAAVSARGDRPSPPAAPTEPRTGRPSPAPTPTRPRNRPP